jgi:hypothetical protein
MCWVGALGGADTPRATARRRRSGQRGPDLRGLRGEKWRPEPGARPRTWESSRVLIEHYHENGSRASPFGCPRGSLVVMAASLISFQIALSYS